MGYEDYPTNICISNRQTSRLHFAFTPTVRQVWKGSFSRFEVCMLELGGSPVSVIVQMNIDTGSLHTTNTGIERRLKCHSCLDVKRYPAITFLSSEFKKSHLNNYQLNGVCTLYEVSRPVVIDLCYHPDPIKGKGSVDFRSSITFDYTDRDFENSRRNKYKHAIKNRELIFHAHVQFDPWNERDLSVFDVLTSIH